MNNRCLGVKEQLHGETFFLQYHSFTLSSHARDDVLIFISKTKNNTSSNFCIWNYEILIFIWNFFQIFINLPSNPDRSPKFLTLIFRMNEHPKINENDFPYILSLLPIKWRITLVATAHLRRVLMTWKTVCH